MTTGAFKLLIRTKAMIRGFGLAILAAAVAGLVASCASKHEMSDDEWCKSFEYRPGTRAYQDCRERVDRQRQRGQQQR
jgi:hypothetical protein